MNSKVNRPVFSEEELCLVRPTLDYAEEIMAVKAEILVKDADNEDAFAGCSTLKDVKKVSEWLELLAKYEDTEKVPEGMVPSTTYLAIRKFDNKVVGIIDLRHHIDHPILDVWGGHMGYSIRPSERGKKYAKEMVRLNLEECKKHHLDKVMITCSEWNKASERVILANGGVYEKTVEVEGDRIKRYWISL